MALATRRDEVILRKRRYDLKNLVAGIKATNRRGEVDWGRAEVLGRLNALLH